MPIIKAFHHWLTPANVAKYKEFLDYSIQLEAFTTMLPDTFPTAQAMSLLVGCFQLDTMPDKDKQILTLVRQLIDRKDYLKVNL